MNHFGRSTILDWLQKHRENRTTPLESNFPLRGLEIMTRSGKYGIVNGDYYEVSDDLQTIWTQPVKAKGMKGKETLKL